jgi:hypothetical protein
MIFSPQFLDMWEEDSPMRNRWFQLEESGDGFDNNIIDVMLFQNRMRTISEINDDVKNKKYMKDPNTHNTLFLEYTNHILNRTLLRSLLKIRDSNELFFISCNNANLYGCSLAQRSIIEHLGLMQYLYDNVSWKDSHSIEIKGIKDYYIKTLYPLYFGSTFNWDKFLKEASSIVERPEININDWKRQKPVQLPLSSHLVKCLDNKFSELDISKKGFVQLMYTILSDILHPSTGGDFIYSDDVYGRLNVSNKFNSTFRRFISVTCFLMPEFIQYTFEITKKIQDCYILTLTD